MIKKYLKQLNKNCDLYFLHGEIPSKEIVEHFFDI